MVFLVSTDSTNIDLSSLNAASLLANAVKTRLAAVIIGEGAVNSTATEIPPQPPLFQMRGVSGLLNPVDEIYVLEDPLLANAYINDAAKAVARFLKDKDVSCVVCPASGSGNVVAALIAVTLAVPCVVNVSGLKLKDDNISASRPIYGATLIETVSIKGAAVLTIAPRAFKVESRPEKQAVIYRIKAQFYETDIKSRIKEKIKTWQALDISTAQIVVSGGRGVGGPDGFKLLEGLASLINGAVGASRGAVDAGWTTHTRQVGQTGKTVSPHIYIACGISGAPQHLAGMRRSDLVMAINTDPLAPFMRESDMGIVADLHRFIPLLIDELRSSRR